MLWVLVCALIVLFGGGYLFLQAREVWRKASRLLNEVTRATEVAEAAMARGQGDDTA